MGYATGRGAYLPVGHLDGCGDVLEGGGHERGGNAEH